MTGSGASTANAGWPTTPRCALPQATAAPALSATRRRLAAAAHAARLSRPQTKKTHENGVGHKQAVEEFLKKTFSRGREERTEDKELQDELRAIEEAALNAAEKRRHVFVIKFNGDVTASQVVAAHPSPSPNPNRNPDPNPTTKAGRTSL